MRRSGGPTGNLYRISSACLNTVLEGERVLVTGGAGFIGARLVQRLAPRNDVAVLDDLSTGSLLNLEDVRGKVHLVRASILDRGAVLRAAKGRSFVFHLAARTSVPESFEQPHLYGDVNVLGTANVLAAAIQTGAQAVVFASSCAVYGSTRVDRIPETKRPNPRSPYAATKLAGEQLSDAAMARDGVRVVKLRIFNSFGPRQSASSPYASVVARFCAAVAKGSPVVVFGSGNQSRDFVYVDDIARAFELAAASRGAAGHIINVGSGRGRTLLEIIRALERIAQHPISVAHEARREGDVSRSCADVRKARRLLGFRSETRFEDGLRRVYEHRLMAPA